MGKEGDERNFSRGSFVAAKPMESFLVRKRIVVRLRFEDATPQVLEDFQIMFEAGGEGPVIAEQGDRAIVKLLELLLGDEIGERRFEGRGQD